VNGRRALDNRLIIDGVYAIFIAACVILRVIAQDDAIQ